MPPALCVRCLRVPATLVRPKDSSRVCRACFLSLFEQEVHETITRHSLFRPGMKVAIGASGGKDSTVLARVLSRLNSLHSYGLSLFLLSVDEGISGYRDDSLESVKRNQREYGLPLRIVSYEQIYGWSMDRIVEAIGTRSNCSYCGILRRQALDRGAQLIGAEMIVTGHNCDDMAETVLMNVLRGDISRLDRCVEIVTGGAGKGGGDGAEEDGFTLPRCKPFKYCYEKEIVMYAYYNELDYFSTECKYAPFAYRGFAREYLKELEKSEPRSILNIVTSAESLHVSGERKEEMKKVGKCSVCGFISSNRICKACVLLEGLNKGRALKLKKAGREEEEKEEGGDAAQVRRLEIAVDVTDAPIPHHPYKQQPSTSASSSPPPPPASSPPLSANRAAAPVAMQQSRNVTDW